MSDTMTIRYPRWLALLWPIALLWSLTAQAAEPLLVIHGGAGSGRSVIDDARAAEITAVMSEALKRGHQALADGKPAMDAVTAAITVMEDSPLFNAGRGAVFTHEGRNELDAAIMDGHTLKAGAAAGVTIVRNPILLARAILEHSPHVMLAGPGAEAFAREQGLAIVEPSYFFTEQRWKALQDKLKQGEKAPPDTHRGTVGAVALDQNGYLAAGTSTGGMTDKRWGRIGDSPIIGAGTYADAHCAVSGTGWGEYYIRTVAAHSICVRIDAGQSARDAARAVINQQIPALGGDGGAIVLSDRGEIATPFNTGGMARGWIGKDGKPHVTIFEADDRDVLSALKITPGS